MKEVKLIFAHDTEQALASVTALVNTARDDVGVEHEALPDLAALEAFVLVHQWSGQRAHDEQELAQVRQLRPRLARWWFAAEDEAVELVNSLLLEFRALPYLTKHDGWDYHLHATPDTVPLAHRMAVEAAMAMSDVIRMKELARLRTCAAPECDRVVIDLSKNRSRRFCEAGCGNRANVAAFRARRAQ